MNYNKLLKTIADDEGFRSKPYKDTLGVWTIAFGNTTILGKPITENTPPVTVEEGTVLLHAAIFQAILDAQTFYSGFTTMVSDRQIVLVSMSYQLGLTNLSKFVNFKAALIDCDWQRAAASMRSSLWARQIPARVEKLAKMMENG